MCGILPKRGDKLLTYFSSEEKQIYLRAEIRISYYAFPPISLPLFPLLSKHLMPLGAMRRVQLVLQDKFGRQKKIQKIQDSMSEDTRNIKSN